MMDGTISEQIHRFVRHPGVAEDKAGALAQIGELSKAFSVANSEAEVVAIGDRLMRTQKYFPLPVDVEIARDAIRAEEIQAAREAPRDWDKPRCSVCQDTGWSGTEVRIHKGVPYECAVRCGCVGMETEAAAQ